MFVISRMERQPGDGVDEQRLAERRAAARAALEVDRRLHRHERQRHELGEAAARAAAARAPGAGAAPSAAAVDVTEHHRHVRAQADPVRGVVHLEPLVGRHLVGADDRAHLVVEDLGGRARQRAEPEARRRSRYVASGEPERRGALPHLERGERVDVQPRAAP